MTRPTLTRVDDGWQLDGVVPPAVFRSLEAFEVWYAKQAKQDEQDEEQTEQQLELWRDAA